MAWYKGIKDNNCAHINLDVDYQKRAKQPTFEGSNTFKFANKLMYPNKNPKIFLQINIIKLAHMAKQNEVPDYLNKKMFI